MEKITRLANYSSELKLKNKVLVPKRYAKDFFIYLKMVDKKTIFSECNGKILFSN
jgi:hypothetical protein